MAGAFLSASLVVSCLLGAASGTVIEAEKAKLRPDASMSVNADDTSRTIVLAADPKVPHHDLVICNGYAHIMAIEVVNLRLQEKLTSAPLDYKQCSGYKPLLQEGDRLEFKVGNSSIGIFRATGLPKTVSSLLLIPHRRVPNSLTAAFESHAFAPNGGPQIAVVDAYRGKEVGKVRIMDTIDETKSKEEKHSAPRVEDLRFNSVVSLSPGKYQVLLQSKEDKDLASAALQVYQDEASYVVMRTGISMDDKDLKNSFPQELVVFEHRSGAAAMGLSLLTAAVTLCLGLRIGM